MLTEINYDLEPEALTDKTPTKILPCRTCGRPCIVTTFASALKTQCTPCRELDKALQKQESLATKATKVKLHTVTNLKEGLINPIFGLKPLCPFDPTHMTELKSVCHTPNYGPRHLVGYDKKGIPQYKQETGESVVYQCTQCNVTISYSTQHQQLLVQNEARDSNGHTSSLEAINGVKNPVSTPIFDEDLDVA